MRTRLVLTLLLILGGGVAIVPQHTQAQQPTAHPRLWITADDLPRLRAWAVDSNPVYSEGLALLAENAKAEMDAGNIQDSGSITWEQYPTEMYAALFAFMSLVENDPAVRDDYGQRARSLLMSVMDLAAQGTASGEAFRDPEFAIYDRSRWWGESFGLTVDWIYPYLSTEDKQTIRTVFLRWIDEDMNAETTAFNHPEPAGVYNDPALLSDPAALRWSANNYYLAHMRNIGLMAMALDDPDGRLHQYLQSATGAWLYRIDNLLRTQLQGGFSPEGWEYGPDSLGSLAQFLLALHTAGQDDPAQWGQQVAWDSNPFWQDVIPAYLHSLSPATVIPPSESWIGPVYQPAWYGDGQDYQAPDFIGLFGPMGLYAYDTGDSATLNAIRWAERNTPPGGADGMLLRVGDAEIFRDAILYFLLFDPNSAAPTEPRPAMPTRYYAPGLGRILARTDWSSNAAWFTFHLSWLLIDHQLAEGGQFEFYRQGEWLTSARVGWDGSIEPYGCNIGRSDYHNTLALQNAMPDLEPDHFLLNCYQHGSQWLYAASGDGKILAHSFGDGFVYALGDLTALYNSTELEVNDILHASRSIIWLEPDTIVVYDRAISQTAGRFKRFWLNTPTLADVSGNQATVMTDGGQQLVVTTLLPTDAVLTAGEAEPLTGEVAIDQPMNDRLMVEAPGGPAEAYFLHTLQGLDAGAAPSDSVLVNSSEGTAFSGAAINGTLVMFPVDLDAPLTELHYAAPDGTQRQIITGLTPAATYDVSLEADGMVTVRPGTGFAADDGGVLVIEQNS